MHENLPEHVVAFTALALFASSLVAIAAKRLRLPFTVVLVVVGLALGEMARQIPFMKFLASIELSPEAILFIFLPILVFESAFNLDARLFLKNLGPILLLAVPILLLSTFVTGFILHWSVGIQLGVAILFGALISATDPVAVVALFRELGAPRRLTVLVEGESLVNDGTALVVFNLILGILIAGETVTSWHWISGSFQFLQVALGGVLVGGLLGLFCARLIGAQEEEPLIEIALSLVLAPAAFIVAEKLHCSGVISVVTAGLLMGSYGRTKFSPSSLPHVEEIWEFLAFVANSLIFLLVGISVQLGGLMLSWKNILGAVVACTIARALGVFILVPITQKLTRMESVGWRYQSIIVWGGLRGALALGIALSLPEDFSGREQILELTVGVVLFTVLVNGLTTSSIVRFLGVDRLSAEDQLEQQEGALLAKEKMIQGLPELAARAGLLDSVVDPIRTREETRVAEIQARLKRIRDGSDLEGMPPPDRKLVATRAALRAMKAHLHDLFTDGLLSEGALVEIEYDIDCQMDLASTGRGTQVFESRHPPLTRLCEWIVSKAAARGLVPRLVGQFRLMRTASLYETARGRHLSADSSLEVLRQMIQEGVVDAADSQDAQELLEAWKTRAAGRERTITDQFAGYVKHVQATIVERHRLNRERKELKGLLREGMVSDRAHAFGLKALEAQLGSLSKKPHHRLLVRPVELLKQIHYFRSLPPEILTKLGDAMVPLTYLDGETVVQAGESSDSLYLVGRGSVAVDEATGEVLAMLGPGEFFGEGGFLTGKPRSHQVRSLTPSVLLQLSRNSIRALEESLPEFAEALRLAHEARAHVPSSD